MFRAFRNLTRLFTIARVLARHDALFLLEDMPVAGSIAGIAQFGAGLSTPKSLRALRPGQRLAKALERLGPTFIKLGQALSTRPDLVGEAVASDLAELQDSLPPFAAATARAIVAEDLGKPIEAIFSSFDDQPVAAASIAQVHFAVTLDGDEVAVKILRPGVVEAFRRDLDMLSWLAELIEAARPSWRRLKPVEAVATFAESVRLEMDLRFEAAAAAEMRENFAGDETFAVPAVDWQRTAQRVMTLERVHGIPIDEVERMQAEGIDVDQVLEKAATAFFNMVFRDGFFHADMHPGNLFVDHNGNLIAVDFGITGRVDQATRRFLAEMLLGFLNGDYRRVAEVHFEAGYVPADKSVDHFMQAARSIAEPILGLPLHEISVARLLGQLFQVTETFAMETQPQLLLLQKSMLVAEGVGRLLNPNLNMWHLARPLIEDWMIGTLGPGARIKTTLSEVLLSIERLPRLIAEAEKATGLLGGGLRLHPDTVKVLTGRSAGRKASLLPGWLPWLAVVALAVALVLK